MYCLCGKLAILFLLWLSSIKGVRSEDDVCEMNACDALVQSKMDLQEYIDSLEEKNRNHSALVKLERRLRSLEQPVWRISRSNERWLQCEEGPCKCKPETKSLSCWQQNLRELPAIQVLPNDVVSIDLGLNAFSTLHKSTFKTLMRLSELDFFDNKIDHLPDGIFDDLEALQYLRLDKNEIEEISSQLLIKQNLLKSLDISSNKIIHLHGEVFKGCSTLLVLQMSRNLIKILPETLFNHLGLLEDLDISNNEIERLPKFLFTDLKKLKRLHLNNNKLDFLPSGLFDTLINLEFLNLRKNSISIIGEKLFNSLESLKELHLTSNNIKQISKQDFKNLNNLVELHLGHNLIADLNEKCFQTNANLRKLLLFSNNLEELKENSFSGLTNLTSLVINNNILKVVHQETFEHLLNLEKLSIDNNNLQFIPTKSFDRLNKLNSITLSNNPWFCDCKILYLAMWLDQNENKVWDLEPTCTEPKEFKRAPLRTLNFDDLCDGQWASMLNLSPRIPVKPAGSNIAANEYSTTISTTSAPEK